MFPQRVSPDPVDSYTHSAEVDDLLHSTKPALLSYPETAAKPTKSRTVTNLHQDPSVPSVPDTIQPLATPKESQVRLKALVTAVLKVLTKDQVMVVVMAPHSVHWITTHQQKPLSNCADSVESITAALVPMLGGPNSELVAEHLVKASSSAQMGMPTQHTIELHASERSYKADLDCYFGEPNLQAIVALLTPMHDNSFSGYERAQLSCIRYHISIEGVDAHIASPPAPPSHFSPSGPASTASSHRLGEPITRSHHSYLPPSASAAAPNRLGWAASYENEALNDFIPSMAYRELDYFYSLLPGNGHPEYAVDVDIERSESVQEHEQRAVDPDTLDPHMRMRMLQQSSLMPVLPREPRKFAEVQQEIFDARLLALQRVTSSTNKKSDVKCLECGTENSPEWRKGPLGPKTLCNRCGLRYAKRLRGQK